MVTMPSKPSRRPSVTARCSASSAIASSQSRLSWVSLEQSSRSAHPPARAWCTCHWPGHCSLHVGNCASPCHSLLRILLRVATLVPRITWRPISDDVMQRLRACAGKMQGAQATHKAELLQLQSRKRVRSAENWKPLLASYAGVHALLMHTLADLTLDDDKLAEHIAVCSDIRAPASLPSTEPSIVLR